MVMKYDYNGGYRGANYIRNSSGIVSLDRRYVDETSLFSFTTFTFTPAGATGSRGPTAANTAAAYAGAIWLASYFNNASGVQTFTIPISGAYTVEAAGARGGNNTAWSIAGSNGAIVTATFNFNAGDEIKMVVGQEGANGYYTAGGGGGSFLCLSDNTPVIIAGGGGGSAYYSTSFLSPEGPGRISGLTAGANTTGGRGYYSNYQYPSGQTGAVNGEGGQDGHALRGANTTSGTGFSSGAGGGGLIGRGGYNAAQQGYQEAANGGFSFTAGGLGGEKNSEFYSGDGGFGGGGSGEYWYNVGAGGGGGFSGGGGGLNWGGGGGGSSYVGAGATNITATQTRTGPGYIILTKL